MTKAAIHRHLPVSNCYILFKEYIEIFPHAWRFTLTKLHTKMFLVMVRLIRYKTHHREPNRFSWKATRRYIYITWMGIVHITIICHIKSNFIAYITLHRLAPRKNRGNKYILLKASRQSYHLHSIPGTSAPEESRWCEEPNLILLYECRYYARVTQLGY